MNKKIYTLVLLAILVGNISAKAQLDNARSRMKKNKSDQSDNSGTSAQSAGPKAEADFKENPLPPCVNLYSVLDDGFRISALHDPFPYPGIIEVGFCPSKDVNGNPLFSRETKGPASPLAVVVRNSSGDIMYKYYYNMIDREVKPVIATSHADEMNSFVIEDSKKAPWPAGNYTVEYTISDKVIFSMPFELVVGKNDDPYANKKEIRAINGYWSKYACYTFEKKANNNLIFNTWETNHDMKFNGEEPKEEKYKIEVQLFYNGKPFSSVMKKENSCFRGKWQRVWFTFTPAGAKNASTYINQDNMKDGNYVFKMTYNGKAREYPFSIKDGKPVPIAEQDKTKVTDPTKVFEGINQYWFVKNTKA